MNERFSFQECHFPKYTTVSVREARVSECAVIGRRSLSQIADAIHGRKLYLTLYRVEMKPESRRRPDVPGQESRGHVMCVCVCVSGS